MTGEVERYTVGVRGKRLVVLDNAFSPPDKTDYWYERNPAGRRRAEAKALELNGWIPLGEVARGHLGIQCLYASQFVGGHAGKPDLGAGLRFMGDWSDYHAMRIHNASIEEFVRRVRAWYEERFGGFEDPQEASPR